MSHLCHHGSTLQAFPSFYLWAHSLRLDLPDDIQSGMIQAWNETTTYQEAWHCLCSGTAGKSEGERVSGTAWRRSLISLWLTNKDLTADSLLTVCMMNSYLPYFRISYFRIGVKGGWILKPRRDPLAYPNLQSWFRIIEASTLELRIVLFLYLMCVASK